MSLDIATVANLIIGLFVALNSLGMLRMSRKIDDVGKTRIVNNPLGVEIAKSYMTREECAACMRDHTGDLKEMKALYDKMMVLLMERDERANERLKLASESLAEKIIIMGDQIHDRITQVTDEGAERRRRIHDKLNEHADQLARIDARTDVSKAIGKAAGAILALSKKES